MKAFTCWGKYWLLVDNDLLPLSLVVLLFDVVVEILVVAVIEVFVALLLLLIPGRYNGKGPLLQVYSYWL
jgi:hypothetical protein